MLSYSNKIESKGMSSCTTRKLIKQFLFRIHANGRHVLLFVENIDQFLRTQVQGRFTKTAIIFGIHANDRGF
jgi:hypothetical protein